MPVAEARKVLNGIDSMVRAFEKRYGLRPRHLLLPVTSRREFLVELGHPETMALSQSKRPIYHGLEVVWASGDDVGVGFMDLLND